MTVDKQPGPALSVSQFAPAAQNRANQTTLGRKD